MTAQISQLTVAETASLTRGITRLSVAVALVLSVMKLAAWAASGSIAMLASLADSGLDLLAAMITFFAVRYAATPADREHRYGHGKAEAFASLLQAGLVFASAALIADEAITHLLQPKPISHEGWGMGVMGVSILMTGVLIYAQSRVLAQTRSVAVEGDRMHYGADLASNVIALVGIGASAVLRRSEPDAVGGLIVGGWLVWGAISVFRRAAFELMDHELPDAQRRRIATLMRADARVTGVHQMRTRASGPYVHIQVHADLEPGLSLVEAHQVMVAAEKRVLEAFPAADIIIHPDPRGLAEPHGGAFGEGAEAHAAPAARQRRTR
ncbi:MAG TPA: cation diffusion facilitator family transporter [Caulobacteraceae bacterium]|jgi:cation diffusion facilitator family transporter|nr:cation diffusion facilitator family transporter [Caulobacteraceae bacterium]